MKLHSFQELTSRIVHLSTRDAKPISISFSGDGAYTTTKTVNIPTLPSGTILTPNQLSIWLGYVIHEGPGHQTHTDLSLYEATCRQRNNSQFSYILNLLEDIRIENADIKTYPGDRKYLDATHIFVDSKIPSHLANNPDIMGLIYKHLFVNHRHLDTNIIKGNLNPITAKLISEIDQCSSTQDCITLTNKILIHLKQKQEESKQEQQQENQEQNQSENKEDQNQSSSDQTGEEDGKDRNNQPNNSNPSPSPDYEENNSDEPNSISDDSNDSNGTSSNGKINSNNSNDDNDTDDNNNQHLSNVEATSRIWQEITEIKNIVKSLLENQIEPQIENKPDLSGKSIFPPKNILNDRIYIPSDEDISTYNSTRTNASSQILALKKMFRIYLQAQTKKSQLRGLEEGKLDHQRLYVAATGANTIFKDQTIKLLPETAIELMIDMSGSMNENISRTAAIILAEALSSIPQIKLSISGFTTNNLGRENIFKYYNRHNISPNSGRQCGMDILQFKNFSEAYAKCKSKLGAITSDGDTPLGDAYGKSLEHILPRPEIRKIIFLITDGRPGFPHGANHSDYLLMKKIHLTAKRYKVQTLGLGIGNCEFLSDYFDQVINIKKIQDLPTQLLIALKFFI